MHRVDVRDMLGGGILVAVGGLSALKSADYSIGTVRNMGPGFFPLVLSLILLFFGLCVLIPAFWRAGERIEVQWKELLVVTFSVIAFAVLLEPAGILLSIVATVLVVSLASALTLRQAATVGVIMAAMVWLVFIVGLGMNIPLTPWSY